jgi:hypothetical protein
VIIQTRPLSTSQLIDLLTEARRLARESGVDTAGTQEALLRLLEPAPNSSKGQATT